MRISDVMKKGSGPEPEPEKPGPGAAPQEKKPADGKKEADQGIAMAVRKASAETRPETARREEVVSVAQVLRQDVKKAEELYEKAEVILKQAFAAAIDKRDLPSGDINEITGQIVDKMMLGDKSLLGLVNRWERPGYVYRHCINVMIMSLEIGSKAGLNKSELKELANAAYLHDLGMSGVMDIVEKVKKISFREAEQVRGHVFVSADIIKESGKFPDGVITAIQQHHERMDGTGYPNKLKGENIGIPGRILGLSDAYEASTHPRFHREGKESHVSIKEIMKLESGAFDGELVRILVSNMGIFAIGSWVRLTTGEVGKVMQLNSSFPLRPVVSVMFDPRGKRLDETRNLDLAEQRTVSIHAPVEKIEVDPETGRLKLPEIEHVQPDATEKRAPAGKNRDLVLLAAAIVAVLVLLAGVLLLRAKTKPAPDITTVEENKR